MRSRRERPARRQIDGQILFGVARLLDDERVPSGFDLDGAGDRAEGRAVLGVDLDGRAVLSVDAHRAEDGDERERDVLLLADDEVDPLALGRLVSRELDDDLVTAGSEAEVRGCARARAEVLSVEVDGGAGRVGVDLEHRDERSDAAEGVVDAMELVCAGLARPRVDVVPVSIGRGLQLLVRAGDVEEHVAVRDEPVRREEVLESAREVGLLVRLGAELELEVGFVGEVVGAGGRRSSEEQRQDQQ